MENPWLKLTEDNFILPDDLPYVTIANQGGDSEYILHTELPPVPYIGDPRKASVIVLAKNPGYAGTEFEEMQKYPTLVQHNFDALQFKCKYPFFFLDPELEGSAGYKWWDINLKDVLAACSQKGINRQRTISQIACVEWFPYHSKRFQQPSRVFPSQYYSFELVKEAVQRGAVFVILFGSGNERLWRSSVPSLPPNCIRLNSVQTTRLSKSNMQPSDFARLVSAIV